MKVWAKITDISFCPESDPYIYYELINPNELDFYMNVNNDGIDLEWVSKPPQEWLSEEIDSVKYNLARLTEYLKTLEYENLA